MKPKSAGENYLIVLLSSLTLKFVYRSKFFTFKIREVADILEYRLWLDSYFDTHKICRSRESVWKEIVKDLGDKKFAAYEFGVAWGYMTWFWFSSFGSSIESWDGFDTFYGLPRKWRNLPEGYFQANGKPPQLNDHRINWHIGYVEKNISELEINEDSNILNIFLFDLDLREPSEVVWNKIKKDLRIGDILYFDEAFDNDERQLIEKSVLTFGNFNFVGASWTSLALKFEGIGKRG